MLKTYPTISCRFSFVFLCKWYAPQMSVALEEKHVWKKEHLKAIVIPANAAADLLSS
jgi:hypothetical protein